VQNKQVQLCITTEYFSLEREELEMRSSVYGSRSSKKEERNKKLELFAVLLEFDSQGVAQELSVSS
jgi:hypothetical protein